MTTLKQIEEEWARATSEAVNPSRSCIRLRGMPWDATVALVMRFLGEHATNIDSEDGLQFIYDRNGMATGEAFIQMNSEVNARVAARSLHRRRMKSRKCDRYVEAYQCYPHDIQMVLANVDLDHPTTRPAVTSQRGRHPRLQTTASASRRRAHSSTVARPPIPSGQNLGAATVTSGSSPNGVSGDLPPATAPQNQPVDDFPFVVPTVPPRRRRAQTTQHLMGYNSMHQMPEPIPMSYNFQQMLPFPQQPMGYYNPPQMHELYLQQFMGYNSPQMHELYLQQFMGYNSPQMHVAPQQLMDPNLPQVHEPGQLQLESYMHQMYAPPQPLNYMPAPSQQLNNMPALPVPPTLQPYPRTQSAIETQRHIIRYYTLYTMYYSYFYNRINTE